MSLAPEAPVQLQRDVMYVREIRSCQQSVSGSTNDHSKPNPSGKIDTSIDNALNLREIVRASYPSNCTRRNCAICIPSVLPPCTRNRYLYTDQKIAGTRKKMPTKA